MPWTYDPANLLTTPGTPASTKDAVRFLIGDIKSDDQQLDDNEIYFAISLRSSIYGSAATLCRTLATMFARKADSQQGPLHTAYSQISRNYAMMASRFENDASSAGSAPGYAGGISVSDKSQREQDSDRVSPEFTKGLTDNFLPVAPAGNETESGASAQNDA